MSDIFDEVDDILSEVTDELAGTEAELNKLDDGDGEKGFNDSELQDIMAEIESLEKEFENETTLAQTETFTTTEVETEVEPEAEVTVSMAEPIVVPIIQTELQTEIDRELEMSMVEKEEEELIEAAKVLSFEKTTPPTTLEAVAPVSEVTPIEKTTPQETTSGISFEAYGSMNLNLGFKIGEESARLSIDPVHGLTVTMSGVKLTIKNEEGCTVVMDNGVRFTIPLGATQEKAGKKAA